jgi:hypothetical protein
VEGRGKGLSTRYQLEGGENRNEVRLEECGVWERREREKKGRDEKEQKKRRAGPPQKVAN